MKAAALLLAGGHSRRFGPSNKLLAAYKNRPLISHSADAVRCAKVSVRVATVRDAAVAEHLDGFDCVQLTADEDDQSASLRAGVARCLEFPIDHLLVVLADMPGITPAHLNAVLERGSEHGAAATVFQGAAMPPACFSVEIATQLLAVTGDQGARKLIKGIPKEELVEADADLIKDIDEPRDIL